MGYNSKEYKAYYSFIGGQNSAAAPDNINDDEVISAVNMDVVTRGSLRTRAGTTNTTWACLAREGASEKVVTRMAEFSLASGELVQLLLDGGDLIKRGETTPLLTECGKHMDYTVYNNKMYLLIKNSFYVYDGTTIAEVTNSQSDSQLATIKKCKYIESRSDRIFCSGNPEAANALYYSQVGDPTYFKGGSYVVNAASADGDVITGLREFNEAMLVFKAHGIWAWFGYDITSDVKFVKLNVHTGTTHYRTICNVNSLLTYLGDDGVYALKSTYSGGLDTIRLSDAIGDVFEDIYSASNKFENMGNAVYEKGKLVLSFPSGEASNGYCNTTVVCHVASGGSDATPWTIYKGTVSNAVMRSGDGEVYYASAIGRRLFKYDEDAYTDADEDIEFKVQTKDYDMGSPIHLKKIKMVWIALNQYKEVDSKTDIQVQVDYIRQSFEEVSGSESWAWGKAVMGKSKWGWLDTVTRTLKVSTKGLRCGLTFTDKTTTAAPNRLFLYGVSFGFKPKKAYKDKTFSNTI